MNLEDLKPEELLALAKEQQAKIADLETAAASPCLACGTKDQLLEEQAAKIETLNGIIGSAKPAQTAIELDSKKQAPVIPTEEVELDGKTYKWNRAKFRLAGDIKVYTAQEASNDEVLLKRLVAVDGQEILIEQA